MDPTSDPFAGTCCPVCGKRVDSGLGPVVDLNVGCMKRTTFDGEPGVVMLSEAQSRDLAVMFSVNYRAGDPESARRKPRRRSVLTEVQLPQVYNGQAELNCCSLACLRRWFTQLVDHLERNSKIGKSKQDPVYRTTAFSASKRKPKTR